MSLKNTAFSVAWRALSERMKKTRWEGQISEQFEQQERANLWRRMLK
jgi:hypothetical protein